MLVYVPIRLCEFQAAHRYSLGIERSESYAYHSLLDVHGLQNSAYITADVKSLYILDSPQ
jgi:hypothetical protein